MKMTPVYAVDYHKETFILIESFVWSVGDLLHTAMQKDIRHQFKKQLSWVCFGEALNNDTMKSGSGVRSMSFCRLYLYVTDFLAKGK